MRTTTKKKKKRNLIFDGMMEGARDALAIAKGEAREGEYVIHVPAEIDVKALRRKLGLSQAEFAARYSFGLPRVKDWEQGRSRPDSVSRAYLKVIEKERRAVDRALRAA